jgi:hypothetical protein
MIRIQQAQLQALQSGSCHSQSNSGSAIEDPAPSDTLHHADTIPATTAAGAGSTPRSPGFAHYLPRSSFDLTQERIRRRSRTPSRNASPRLRSSSISFEAGDLSLAGRDESAFYQAETQTLIRENQMLRARIRELGMLETRFPPRLHSDLLLERQTMDLSERAAVTHEPVFHSSLSRATTRTDESEGGREAPNTLQSNA